MTDQIEQTHYKQLSDKLEQAVMHLIALIPSGRSLQVVARFDNTAAQQAEQVSRSIDQFFTRLLYLPAEQRSYRNAQHGYLDIDLALTALKRRQEMRPLNDLSLRQSELALELWQQDRRQHQNNDGITDFFIKRHRSHYQQLMDALIQGEHAKPA